METGKGATAKAAMYAKAARLVAICSSCKRMRTSSGTWRKMTPREAAALSPTEITHTICPRCIRALYPELAAERALKPSRARARAMATPLAPPAGATPPSPV